MDLRINLFDAIDIHYLRFALHIGIELPARRRCLVHALHVDGCHLFHYTDAKDEIC
jgi:hypothetical protein